MQRVINNIANGKYNPLVNYEISQDEMLGILEGLVNIINKVKRGQLTQYADGLFFIMEMEIDAKIFESINYLLVLLKLIFIISHY